MQSANPDHEGGNPTGGKRALLIGVDAYNFVNPLSGCVNDILAIRQFLVNQAGVPPEQVTLLLAPGRDTQIGPDLGTVQQPTKTNILAAFQTLAGQTAPGDQVVIYYAGHGVQITNPQNRQEHIGAIVAVDAQVNGTNFVINRELNEGIQRVVGAGAQVTVILDSCHSGGATRDISTDPNAPAVREIVLDPQKLDWAAFQAEHGLDGNAAGDGDTRGIAGGSGWVPNLVQGQELIVLSGCRDVQTSHEYTPPGTGDRHGALTFFLLDALKNSDPARVAQLRWQDIYPGIRTNVQSAFADQTPTLEGRGERPLFGGAWQPYAPGFTVSASPGGNTLTLDGGTIHGLGPGAQVAIYPPDTADFSQAAQVAVAEVDSATPVTSQAHIVGTPTAPVANGARAVLIKPSTATPRLAVKLTDVPDAVVAGIRGVQGIDGFVDLAPANQPSVEVRPRAGIDGKDGWVLVKYTSNETALGPNDVIAYAPRNMEGARIDPAKLGEAIGDGLVHWARYWSVLTRHNDEPRLQGAVTLSVLVGNDDAALRQAWGQPDPPIRQPDAAGQVVVGQDEVLLLKVNVAPTSPGALNVVIMLCSDDGNIDLLWPPENAENVLPPGEEHQVGVNGPNPFQLTIREDQSASRYVLKLFASDQAHPFATNSLKLEGTVQDEIDGGLRGGATPSLPGVLWTTVDVPVLVTRQRPTP
jgi:hypothetical protein